MVFSRRNSSKVIEYSGHENVSKLLYERIKYIYDEYYNKKIYQNGRPISFITKEFVHEWNIFHPEKNIDSLFYSDISEDYLKDNHHYYFDFIELINKHTRSGTNTGNLKVELMAQTAAAFHASGSVYEYNIDNESVLLIADENITKQVESVSESINSSASTVLRETYGNLIQMKAEPKNIVKDVYVALESVLKEKTGKSDFKTSVNSLLAAEKIHSVQKEILLKLSAYRSDTFGTTHAGNSKTPEEVDALWYFNTSLAQIDYLTKI